MNNKKILYRCNNCGRRSTISMIKPDKNGLCQCNLCLKRGVYFIPEFR